MINRLQNFKGCPSFNNLFEHCRGAAAGRRGLRRPRAIPGRAGGARDVDHRGWEHAFERAKAADRTYVIEIKVSATEWTAGRRLVGCRHAEESARGRACAEAAAQHAEDKKKQAHRSVAMTIRP